eukprot:m.224081 g.224081  ORF g.224081 m.224081 type:complete len:209 (-) comp17281_c0_seq3:2301-2927(-)
MLICCDEDGCTTMNFNFGKDPEKAADPADVESGDSKDGILSGWFAEPEPDPWFPPLSRTQRILGFVLCSTAAIFCFVVGYLWVPILYLKARKFSLIFTLGSVLSLMAMAMLRGPKAFTKYLFSGPRAWLVVIYLVAIVATLYCAMGLRRTVPTLVTASGQIACLSLLLAGYVPGGTTGLKLLMQLSLATMRNVVFPTAKACVGRVFDV